MAILDRVQILPKGTVCYRVQILLPVTGSTSQLTSEPYYSPEEAVRVAHDLSRVAAESEALLLDERGRLVVTFGWTGPSDEDVPKITRHTQADARLQAALDAWGAR